MATRRIFTSEFKVEAVRLVSERGLSVADVLESGSVCGLHRIEHLMRRQALRARRRGMPIDRGDRLTSVITPNVLDRQLQAAAPNQKWVADVTYLW